MDQETFGAILFGDLHFSTKTGNGLHLPKDILISLDINDGILQMGEP